MTGSSHFHRTSARTRADSKAGEEAAASRTAALEGNRSNPELKLAPLQGLDAASPTGESIYTMPPTPGPEFALPSPRNMLPGSVAMAVVPPMGQPSGLELNGQLYGPFSSTVTGVPNVGPAAHAMQGRLLSRPQVWGVPAPHQGSHVSATPTAFQPGTRESFRGLPGVGFVPPSHTAQRLSPPALRHHSPEDGNLYGLGYVEPRLRGTDLSKRELMDPFEVYSLLNPDEPYDDPAPDCYDRSTPECQMSPPSSPVFSDAPMSRSSSVSLHSHTGSSVSGDDSPPPPLPGGFYQTYGPPFSTMDFEDVNMTTEQSSEEPDDASGRPHELRHPQAQHLQLCYRPKLIPALALRFSPYGDIPAPPSNTVDCVIDPYVERHNPSQLGCSIKPNIRINGELHSASLENLGDAVVELRHEGLHGEVHLLRAQMPDPTCWFCECCGICLEHNPDEDPEAQE